MRNLIWAGLALIALPAAGLGLWLRTQLEYPQYGAGR
ncbi:hypothetical protein Mesop_0528 [Mesorhizobium opportunistum WSM2075]|uniref:Uncharacterized protein n=1 Tax=Mesorhizobium opportunistum (strain LMG 24607 / HAMBI 3007 / WSM2075) TaxID=536019 RepID=F7Y446_MESOW|nr:hypothetical protein Mesop_0528 [Mesorhizobium opportunistum WSM2075]